MATRSMAQFFDLSGKGAIVTGGARGIGQAIAFRLAEAGAGVMIADIDVDAAGGTREEILQRGGHAEVIKADASSAQDTENVVQTAISVFGGIEILINNAGIFPFSPTLEISDEIWDRVININLKGVFLYSRAVARAMIRSGNGGRIVNLASIDALKPSGMLAHYNASKGGVLMLTKAMAREFGPMGIRVNAVAPGSIATPGVHDGMTRMAEAMGMSADEIDENYLQRVPLGRMGDPDDVARAVFFLSSDASDYITGEVIVIDGGHLLT